MALAAVLAVFGAGLAIGLEFLHTDNPSTFQVVLHAALSTLTCVVGVRLAWSFAKVAIHTRARRRRHRMLVDLVAAPDDARKELRILAEQTPLAYCLPSLTDARVVISSGTLAALEDAELRAVLAHERAHLRARHDLVLEAFAALREAFPKFLRGRMALESKALEHNQALVEMLADDAARRQVGASHVARALVRLSESPVPTAALAASGTMTLERVQRMTRPAGSYPLLAAATYAVAAALVVVPTLTVAIPWLARLVEALS
jgi:Zn-dependent protease with chaperone function